VAGASPSPTTTSHTVYIIPRDRLVATAGGTLTVTSTDPDLDDEDDLLDDEDGVVLENHEEILETEEEVLDDDDCLENPPD